MLSAAAGNPADNAREKLDLIVTGQAPAGSFIDFSMDEVNGWLAEEVRRKIPSGVRNPEARFGQNIIVVEGLVDLARAARSTGKEISPMMHFGMQMYGLAGEHPMSAYLRTASSAGRATVYLDRIEKYGAPLPAIVQSQLVQFFLNSYPNAKLGEPIELKHNMDRVEVRPAGGRVLIAQALAATAPPTAVAQPPGTEPASAAVRGPLAPNQIARETARGRPVPVRENSTGVPPAQPRNPVPAAPAPEATQPPPPPQVTREIRPVAAVTAERPRDTATPAAITPPEPPRVERARRPEAPRQVAAVIPPPAPPAAVTPPITVPSPQPRPGPPPVPTSGDLYWNGVAERNQLVVIENGRATAGSVSGAPLPGGAVTVLMPSPVCDIVEFPGAANDWKRLAFRCSRDIKGATLNIQWRR